jgi:hypothetical protein
MSQRKVYLSYDIISGHNAKVIKRRKEKGKKGKQIKIKDKSKKTKGNPIWISGLLNQVFF